MAYRKSFETFLVLLGMFLVLFAAFSTNTGFCYGKTCLPKVLNYAIMLAGIITVLAGVRQFNKGEYDEEWLVRGWD